jgi:uncharacterized membrane protein SirB2
MALIEHYGAFRQAHLAAVGLSLTLFAARGAAVLAGQSWPMRAIVRRTSVAIDTVLLGCGIALWKMLGLNPWRDPWLGVKIALLLVYIVLGSYALKRARTWRAKAACYGAALLCVGLMVGIARAHHPAGAWRWLTAALSIPA